MLCSSVTHLQIIHQENSETKSTKPKVKTLQQKKKRIKGCVCGCVCVREHMRTYFGREDIFPDQKCED